MTRKAVLLAVFNQIDFGFKEEYLDELEDLAVTAGYTIVDKITQNLSVPDSRQYLGKGKLLSAEKLIGITGAEVAITRHNLNPSQKNKLEKGLGHPVIDRTQLILEIFENHASTKEGRFEVEMARLKYELPRLKGIGKTMSQTGAGIGTRGPGEKKLEIDRRLALKRISRLRQEISQLRKEREIARKKRLRSNVPVVSFVGYTNAGKSSLVSLLSNQDLLIENKLFSTLDTRTRRLSLPGGEVVLISDTVGFIRELPHELMESFKSTLEEAAYANLICVVADASDNGLASKLEVVDSTLKEIGADTLPRILVLNKIDRCTNLRLEELEMIYPDALFLSALHGYNIQELTERIEKEIHKNMIENEIVIKPCKVGLFLKFKEELQVLSEKYENENLKVRYLASERIHNKMVSLIGEDAR